MKRPDLYTLFAPCAPDPIDATRGLLAALPDGDRGFALGDFYGAIVFDPEVDYEPTWNTHELKTPDELLALIRQHNGGMWTSMSNLRFHSSDIHAFHYFAHDDPHHLHTAISTDPHVTRFLENSSVARGDYIVFLSRVATALNADYFISGVNMEGILPISPVELLSEAGFKGTFKGKPAPYPYILGWRDGLFDPAQIAAGWGLDPDEVLRTLDGYAVLHRLP